MKNIYFAIMVFISSFTFINSVAQACMPPDPSTPIYQMQKAFLQKIINDPLVEKTIVALKGNQGIIKSLSLSTNGYLIELGDNCSFIVNTDFSDSSPGTCPHMLPLKIVSLSCN